MTTKFSPGFRAIVHEVLVRRYGRDPCPVCDRLGVSMEAFSSEDEIKIKMTCPKCRAMKEVVAKFQSDGRVVLVYHTNVPGEEPIKAFEILEEG